jgi:hypothetical protein
MSETPVLIIGFNRPDLVVSLIDQLRPVQPRRLYLAVDGPRAHVASDFDAVAAVQAVTNHVDWECDVRTNFQEANLGCGPAVSRAISWVFTHEERAIILEDDIRPSASFFPFCAELLDRYADDRRVGAISGFNLVPQDTIDGDFSYRFSSLPSVWGWASWRRAWNEYRLDLSGWRSTLPTRRLYDLTGKSIRSTAYWTTHFEAVRRGYINTWDYQLVYSSFANGLLTATANAQLIDNVGFRDDATHSAVRPRYLDLAGPQPRDVHFPLNHPPVVPDCRADAWMQRNVYRFPVRRSVRVALGRLRP